LLAEGVAELVHDVGADAGWRDQYVRMARRYVDEKSAEAYVTNTTDQPRGLYRLELNDAKVSSWRMPVKGEASMGIWHERYYEPGTDF
jgi:hypothetical protein